MSPVTPSRRYGMSSEEPGEAGLLEEGHSRRQWMAPGSTTSHSAQEVAPERRCFAARLIDLTEGGPPRSKWKRLAQPDWKRPANTSPGRYGINSEATLALSLAGRPGVSVTGQPSRGKLQVGGMAERPRASNPQKVSEPGEAGLLEEGHSRRQWMAPGLTTSHSAQEVAPERRCFAARLIDLTEGGPPRSKWKRLAQPDWKRPANTSPGRYGINSEATLALSLAGRPGVSVTGQRSRVKLQVGRMAERPGLQFAKGAGARLVSWKRLAQLLMTRSYRPAVTPPSTGRTAPVIQPARSSAR